MSTKRIPFIHPASEILVQGGIIVYAIGGLLFREEIGGGRIVLQVAIVMLVAGSLICLLRTPRALAAINPDVDEYGTTDERDNPGRVSVNLQNPSKVKTLGFRIAFMTIPSAIALTLYLYVL